MNNDIECLTCTPMIETVTELPVTGYPELRRGDAIYPWVMQEEGQA